MCPSHSPWSPGHLALSVCLCQQKRQHQTAIQQGEPMLACCAQTDWLKSSEAGRLRYGITEAGVPNKQEPGLEPKWLEPKWLRSVIQALFGPITPLKLYHATLS